MAAHEVTGVVVLTTIPPEFDIDAWARSLLDDGLAACINVLPAMRSVYRWKGAIESADERQVVIKTTRARVAALEAAVRARHPYEVPEFLVLAVTGGSAPYLAWIEAETREAPPGGAPR